MANYLAVVDPNPERRSRFIQTVTPLLPPMPGLVSYACGAADFAAVWAVNPMAPISYDYDGEGAAIVLGEAIATVGSTRLTAAALRQYWRAQDYKIIPAFDGFHVAIAYHPERGLVVGADVLGFFPVYYYQRGDVLLVASSPELFRHHPCFEASFNPTGLVGILLTNGLVEGQTLWANVHRLGEGRLLVYELGRAAKEVTQYSIPQDLPTDKYRQMPVGEQIEAMGHALSQAVSRHTTPSETHVLMLSGGLDSRLLAGFLHRQQVDTVALTFGQRSDLEMQCATQVARALQLPHHTEQVQFEHYAELAKTRAQWEHLANGFSIVFDSAHGNLHRLGSRVVTGFVLDVIMGKAQGYRLFAGGGSFDAFFENAVNDTALSPALLQTLLRHEVFGDRVSETIERMRSRYQNYSTIESRRGLQFKLSSRQRFHIGSGAWRLSFMAWPSLPVLDRQLIETMLAMPAETLDGRRAQKTLLCRDFPQLAQLPLDRNSNDTTPLQPTPMRQRLAPLYMMQRRWRGVQRRLGYERRYYYRVLDINNPGWRAIRRQAEPHRDRLHDLFHPEVLNQLLPAPDQTWVYQKDAILESASVKTLLGLLLWSVDHL